MTRRIVGYAVVCELGHIADADGRMPDMLRHEAEWAFFQRELDTFDAVVMGRRSDEMTPNPKSRRRIVMTRKCNGVARRGALSVLWNPDQASIDRAAAELDLKVPDLAVTGGRDVFGYFLSAPTPYTSVALSRIDGVRVEGGRDMFPDMLGGATPERVLLNHGYRAGTLSEIGERAWVCHWERRG